MVLRRLVSDGDMIVRAGVSRDALPAPKSRC